MCLLWVCNLIMGEIGQMFNGEFRNGQLSQTGISKEVEQARDVNDSTGIRKSYKSGSTVMLIRNK